MARAHQRDEALLASPYHGGKGSRGGANGAAIYRQEAINDGRDPRSNNSLVSSNHTREGNEDYTDEDIQKIVVQTSLDALRDSANIQEAKEAMLELSRMLDENNNDRKANAARLVRLDGIGIVLMGLNQWYSYSASFSKFGLGLLVALTHHYPNASQSIVSIGLKTILETGNQFPDDYFVTGHAVALLCNLSYDPEVGQRVATEDCINFVIASMKAWRTDTFLQERACKYFYSIGSIEGNNKERVRAKGICALLGVTIDKFRSNDAVYQEAKATFNLYV